MRKDSNLGSVFEALDHGVDVFSRGMGDRVHQIIQDALTVFFDHVSGFDQRAEFRRPCGFHPIPQVIEGPRLRGLPPDKIASAEMPASCYLYRVVTGFEIRRLSLEGEIRIYYFFVETFAGHS